MSISKERNVPATSLSWFNVEKADTKISFTSSVRDVWTMRRRIPPSLSTIRTKRMSLKIDILSFTSVIID